jgi:hypothetical protein
MCHSIPPLYYLYRMHMELLRKGKIVCRIRRGSQMACDNSMEINWDRKLCKAHQTFFSITLFTFHLQLYIYTWSRVSSKIVNAINVVSLEVNLFFKKRTRLKWTKFYDNVLVYKKNTSKIKQQSISLWTNKTKNKSYMNKLLFNFDKRFRREKITKYINVSLRNKSYNKKPNEPNKVGTRRRRRRERKSSFRIERIRACKFYSNK